MSKYQDTFSVITLDELMPLAQSKKDAGARFVNIHAKTVEGGFTLTYSFTDDEKVIDNYKFKIENDAKVPSISSLFMSAFFFENETHDLFGIDIEGIAIDFQGNFYQVALNKPMAVTTKDSDMYSVNEKYDAMVPVKERKGE